MNLRSSTISIVYLLLLALSVSGGEGVRLFPIPVAHTETAKIGPGSSARYSLAAHRFSSATKYGKFKSLKKDVSSERANGKFVMPERVESPLWSYERTGFAAVELNYFPPTFRLPVGRAPPV